MVATDVLVGHKDVIEANNYHAVVGHKSSSITARELLAA